MKRHFFSIAGGIRPDKPGFKSVRIEPKFVTHNSVNIVIPHPQGLIKMDLSRDGDLLEGNIELSKELKGVLIWKSKEIDLHEGMQNISL